MRTLDGQIISKRRAITLAEMLVVMGVIVVVMGISLPALSVWESRKEQDSINQMRGLLKSAQQKAFDERREIGLFFYVDPNTEQQVIWPLESALDPENPDTTVDLFRLVDRLPFRLPTPYRVLPKMVLSTVAPANMRWRDNLIIDQLAEMQPSPGYDPDDGLDENDGVQFHRNFFVMLFDKNGAIVDNRRIFILDADQEQYQLDPAIYPQDSPHPGYRTGLTVQGFPEAYANNVVGGTPGSELALAFQAYNEVLVYRDDKFLAQRLISDPDYDDDHKEYLRLNSDTFSVHPITGKVEMLEAPDPPKPDPA